MSSISNTISHTVMLAACNQLLTVGYTPQLGSVWVGEPSGSPAVTRMQLNPLKWVASQQARYYSLTYPTTVEPIDNRITLWTAPTGGMVIATFAATEAAEIVLEIQFSKNAEGELFRAIMNMIVGAANPIQGPFIVRPSVVSNSLPITVQQQQTVASLVVGEDVTNTMVTIALPHDVVWTIEDTATMYGFVVQDTHYAVILSYTTSGPFDVKPGDTVTFSATINIGTVS